MRLAENEGAKFWLNVQTELKNRGLNDILIACVDGLKGFPDAINAMYPEARIRLSIVHMVRNSLRFVSWKDYKAVLRDLKAIYRAPHGRRRSAGAGSVRSRYPQISRSWQAIQAASQKWTMQLRGWRMEMSRFIIEFGDRLDGHF